jgi:hypothetical protein
MTWDFQLLQHIHIRKHARKLFSSSCNKEPIVEFCVLCVAGWYKAAANLQKKKNNNNNKIQFKNVRSNGMERNLYTAINLTI